MQFIDLPTSLFCARVRTVIQYKELSPEVVGPPGGLGSRAHAALDPVARVPAVKFASEELWLHESMLIALRLEEEHPARPLEPASAELRWLGRQGMAFLDSYAVSAMFDILRLADRRHTEDEVERSRERIANAYRWLEQTLPAAQFALADKMTLLDIWLGLTVALGAEFSTRTGLDLSPPRRVAELSDQALSQSSLSKVLAQLQSETQAA
ncbi:glutathione S-transferase family protein [Phenylobacterium sp.]|uniref:glutathione S-transferase family protein n=1 Tax=Phenylobacterium sp. TaxID=1871053 RepID=UPI002FCAB9C3